MPTDEELIAQVDRLCSELDRRARTHRKLEPYYEGDCPLPAAVVQSRMTRAYRYLMPMADAPWGSLIVDSVTAALEVTGINSPDKDVSAKVWEIWHANGLDAESKLAHNAAFLDGRVFTLTEPSTSGPEITLDDSTQMVVEYREGSRRHRTAALRRWVDGDNRAHITLWRLDGIYKFSAKNPDPGTVSTVSWERREVDGEDWPIKRDGDPIPVVELAVNRRLKPGRYGYARGEYEHVTGLIDRINLLTFLGLVVALWQGFPLRGVIGEAILKDDDGNVIPPFDATADSVFQLENPEAKLAEFAAADRKNLSVYAELDQLAVLTATPRHYFPLEGGVELPSADAIRASEGAKNAKIKRNHKPALSEGWEETLRIGGTLLDDPVDLSPLAELEWDDHESRSLAERGDVYAKLGDDLPWQVKAEIALGANAEQIARWQASAASDPLAILARAAAEPVA